MCWRNVNGMKNGVNKDCATPLSDKKKMKLNHQIIQTCHINKFKNMIYGFSLLAECSCDAGHNINKYCPRVSDISNAYQTG